MLEKNKYHEIDVIEGLKLLDDETSDVIIIDPPYNIGKDFGNNKDKIDIDEYIEWFGEWFGESYRVLKPTGSIYIYGFSEILSRISAKIDYNKHRWLIWHYTNKTVPSYKSGWQRSHESIIHTWKNKPIFNVDDVRVPYSESFLKNSVGKKRKGGRARYGNSDDTIYNAHKNGALPRDVIIDISALAGGAGRKERYFLHNGEVYPSSEWKNFEELECIKHPTQKPYKLTEKLLLSSKPKDNGLVIIPFGGSGSEGIVCDRMNLDFIGFDINPDYIKLSNEAVKNNYKLF